MGCAGRNDKTVARANIGGLIANREPKTTALDKGRLHMRVMMKRTHSSRFSESKCNDHQIGMIGQHLPRNICTCFNDREFSHVELVLPWCVLGRCAHCIWRHCFLRFP
jgi:hypothetical protein